MSRPALRIAALLAALALGAALIYGLTAYEFVPSVWRFVERRHPALDRMGTCAFTKVGIPGDPLNLAFIGSEEALQRAMLRAGWQPADPITLKSSLRIAVDSVVHRPYLDAPVSDLYINGKKQDLAFEQAAAGDPSKRHHVRFWIAAERDALDRPLWMGAATFDSGIGLSHETGQITHHIAPEVDAERDKLLKDLQALGSLSFRWIDEFQPQRSGKNGGGDRYVTDGRLAVIVAGEAASHP
ncbi:MAG TPA: LssY C-terminal domain-containing protein [Methylibium sp.]